MNPSVTGIVLAGVLVALAISSIAFLPPLHPAQLWSLPWAVATTLYALRLLPYRSLSWTTTIIASMAAVTFVVGTLGGERLFGGRVTRNPQRWTVSYGTVRTAAIIVVGITLAGAAVFVVSASSLYGVENTLKASLTVRLGIDHGALSAQIKYVWAALSGIALCSAAAGMSAEPRIRLKWLALALICLASIYFATGRATIVAGLVIGLVTYFCSKPAPLQRRRFIAGVCGTAAISLAIFVAGGQLIGKTYANNADLQSLPSVFSRHPAVSSLAEPYEYVSAPIAALDIQVRSASAWGDSHGCAAAVELCRGLVKLGIHAQPIARVRPFTASPLVWNTYTGLDVPLIDWGKLLTVPFLGLLGVLAGIAWAAVRRRMTAWIIVYSIETAAISGSWTTFTFTAPHTVGALVISAAALWSVHAARRGVLGRAVGQQRRKWHRSSVSDAESGYGAGKKIPERQVAGFTDE